ncbi:uncharacterized protein LOC110732690 isoform X2 [Chenopodium quinoa]|uniref:uncharacterized protein LOC110732690 isoform X2 n=1 Tax=Chenopodium quinoa TaxID=63459 RepID=UPI000B78E103|nr:uncharacterized protein LOC110732690 isoform X2 [Chenopodium quinoa]
MGHFGSSMAHTLFAFPIDLCNGNGNGDEKNRRIEPIIEFPAPEYPLVMASAQLGSRIYFVGGERDSWQSELEANQKYPPDVYVFDEQQKTQKLEVGMKMNTGKPSPVAFAADGKLFVLGSCGGPSLISYAFLWPTGLASSSMRFFEVFDPTTNEWTLLDDPPVTTPTIWVSSVVVGRRVYVYGRIVGEGTSGVVLSFHLDSYEWESEHSNDPQFQQLRRHMPNRILLGDTYYGLSQRDDWVVRQKLTEEDEQLLFRLRGADYYESTSGFCHLWDTLFCTVVTGSLHDPGVPGIMLDQYRRFFSIRVFREIQGPLPESISTDLLYSAGYLFQSTYSSIGPLLGCYTFLHSVKQARRQPIL